MILYLPGKETVYPCGLLFSQEYNCMKYLVINLFPRLLK